MPQIPSIPLQVWIYTPSGRPKKVATLVYPTVIIEFSQTGSGEQSERTEFPSVTLVLAMIPTPDLTGYTPQGSQEAVCTESHWESHHRFTDNNTDHWSRSRSILGEKPKIISRIRTPLKLQFLFLNTHHSALLIIEIVM